MRLTTATVLSLMCVACAPPRPVPPEPAPPEAPTFVSAGFDLTWTAALDHLAIEGIAVASRDRRAGVIVTEETPVDTTDALEYADCGSSSAASGGGATSERYRASHAVYEMRVHGDGFSSTVLVVASWNSGDTEAPFQCQTTRVWEDEAQEAIRLAAEANR